MTSAKEKVNIIFLRGSSLTSNNLDATREHQETHKLTYNTDGREVAAWPRVDSPCPGWLREEMEVLAKNVREMEREMKRKKLGWEKERKEIEKEQKERERRRDQMETLREKLREAEKDLWRRQKEIDKERREIDRQRREVDTELRNLMDIEMGVEDLVEKEMEMGS